MALNAERAAEERRGAAPREPIYAAIDSGGGSGRSVKTFETWLPTEKIPFDTNARVAQ